MTSEEIKHALLTKCLEWLDSKIEIANKAMKDAQEAANSEEKSSAGDKYETGRAMSQNDRDLYAKQLAECLKQKQLLQGIDLKKNFNSSVPGSLVFTDTANYFISISAGHFKLEDQSWFMVSADTPIAKLLAGKKAGDSFLLNGKNIQIRNIL